MGILSKMAVDFLNKLKRYNIHVLCTKNEGKNLREKMCLNVFEEVQNNLVYFL